MRLGVLDVGSNTVHLLVVDAHSGARPIPAFSHKAELKLAAHLEDGTSLSGPGESSLRGVVEEALRIAEDKGVEDIIAFATSAVREAVNGEQVLARIREQTGAQINVMTGHEEARLTFLAARRWFGWSSGRLLVIDIGGGSLEVASGIDEEPDVVASLPLGARRLTRDWLSTDPPSAQEVRRLRKHVRAEIARETGRHAPARIPRSRGGDLEDLPAAGQDRGRGSVRRGPLRQARPPARRRRRRWPNGCRRCRRPNGPSCPASRPAGSPSCRPGPSWPTPSSTCWASTSVELCPWALREGVILRRLDMLAQGLGSLPPAGR